MVASAYLQHSGFDVVEVTGGWSKMQRMGVEVERGVRVEF
jgi:hypothetical protein